MADSKKLAIKRKLNIIKGQIEGIADMIENGNPASLVLTQIKAAKNGLNAAGTEIIKTYIKECAKGRKKNAERELGKILKGYIGN